MFLYKFYHLHSLDCLCLAWYAESMEFFITDILMCDLDHDKCSFIAKFLLNVGIDSVNLTLLLGHRLHRMILLSACGENQVTNTVSERQVRFWALHMLQTEALLTCRRPSVSPRNRLSHCLPLFLVTQNAF